MKTTLTKVIATVTLTSLLSISAWADATQPKVVQAQGQGLSYGRENISGNRARCQNDAANFSMQSTNELLISARCNLEDNGYGQYNIWVMRTTVTIITN